MRVTIKNPEAFQYPVSPLTGQKHSQVASDGDQHAIEEVECDGPCANDVKSPTAQSPPSHEEEKCQSESSPSQLEDSVALFENPLQKKLDAEIHQEAAEVIHEVSGGTFDASTDRRRPYDPNLVCPMCRRRFRIGEIQKFRRHVNTCTGTDDD